MSPRLRKRIIFSEMSQTADLQSADESLEPQAKRALGRTSPRLAWEQIMYQLQGAILDHEEACLEMLDKELHPNLPFNQGLPTLQAKMEALKETPALAINYLVDANPGMSLRNIQDDLPPLQVLRALVRMVESPRWLQDPPA